ncbi:hypothetical protein C5N14_24070 [Micromonospora sp. MW-13]|uniref:hypothetical protein n=1 Tax=Micromonospora sp. MW-13 TaxID=2094022 RepID=UPI000E452F10|nr:hypothetical protein [Micromonospora sp. MW-13]RGC66478.1 hypothetical protein C5N14_24070 [Micromonospora sp. MW-13]
MKRFRATSALLTCASLLALAACGGEDTASTAGSAPSASTAASSAATSVSSAPSSTAAAGTTGGASDKKLCEAAKKAGDDMKAELVAALKSGNEPSPAMFKKILTALDEKVTALASTGGDSKVAIALRKFGAEAAKAASATNPADAADNPAFEKAGADITAACKAAGVSVTF